MGQVIDKVTIKNAIDLAKAEEGQIPFDNIRTVAVEGVVDTGAGFLCLPPAIIKGLGLRHSHTRNVITANGIVKRRIFFVASITIKEREIEMQVMENDAQTPTLIGYLVLENMDWVVDPKSQKLIGNPKHDGKWMTDLYLN